MIFGEGTDNPFSVGELNLKLDTAERMIRDVIAAAPRPGFSQLARLQQRIDESQKLFAGFVLKYGKHRESCRHYARAICNCGFEQARAKAKGIVDG